MAVRRKRRATKKKLSTKFKQDPVGTLRSEYRKLSIPAKAAVIGVAAGAVTPAAAKELNRLPLLGKFMSIFTGYGAKLARKLK